MPSSTFSLADATLEALGYAPFAAEANVLRLEGRPPEWLQKLWPKVKAPGAVLPKDVSAALKDFLSDAQNIWQAGGDDEPLRSRLLAEVAPDGTSIDLEGTALTIDGRRILLLRCLDGTSKVGLNPPSLGREWTGEPGHLSTEIQKKEILLHYVAEHMSGALGNIITALRMVELEQNPLLMRKLLDLAAQAARQQQNFIHRILGSFADELESLYAQGEHTAKADADVYTAIYQAAGSAGPNFAGKKVGLDVPTDFLSSTPVDGRTAALRVAIDPVRLERVICNLLENGLTATPPGGRVAVRVDDEVETVRIRVEDGGPPLPEDLRQELFGDLEPLPPQAPATEMRLHYCRLSVENSEGEIGCDPGEAGGNAFWIRLPKLLSPR